MKTDDSLRQGLGFGTRLGTELLVATGIGALMGYALDEWFQTRPWFLAGGLIFGSAAGCLNVYRAAMAHSPPPAEEDKPEAEAKDKLDDLKF